MTPLTTWPSDKKYQPPSMGAGPAPRIQACSGTLGKSQGFLPPAEAGRKLQLRGVLSDLAAFTSKIHCTNYLHCKQQLLLAQTPEACYRSTFFFRVVLPSQHFGPALSALKLPSSPCSETHTTQSLAASQRSSGVLQQASWEERPPSQGSTRQSRTYTEN